MYGTVRHCIHFLVDGISTNTSAIRRKLCIKNYKT
jgi:hypothetical protein